MYQKSFLVMVKIIIGLLVLSVSSHTSVKVDGYFIAQKSCTAVHSIKKGTHPFSLTTDMAYEVMAKNRPVETHYQIRLKGVEENPNRWVSVDCGLFLTDCKTSQTEQLPREKDYLLAISWQPAFCQSHQSKKECQSQTAERYDATHLSLHGLWPQPKNNAYCNVSQKYKSLDRRKSWHLLEELHLSESLFSDLLISMPGVASYLQRHEWIKHGTCYSDSPEIYYRDSLKLLNNINATQINTLFANNIEKTVTSVQIREAFDKAFGAGSGQKVNVKCNGGLITELWVNLQGDIGSENNMSRLLQDAPAVNRLSCESGRIDAVGF